jgi:hypothetical protein
MVASDEFFVLQLFDLERRDELSELISSATLSAATKMCPGASWAAELLQHGREKKEHWRNEIRSLISSPATPMLATKAAPEWS